MTARQNRKKMEKHQTRTKGALLLLVVIWMIDICTANFEDLFATDVIQESTLYSIDYIK